MSQQRFVRCPHCNLPHEAEQTVCPITGKGIEVQTKPRRRRPTPPPSEENYAWEHTLTPWVQAEGSADMDPSELHTLVGRVVGGKYRIEALIGRGGMGAVYRAVNEPIRKAVALKILYRGFDQHDAEPRFLREARVASSLGHPNIVEVFDLGHLDDGKPFQVMELLEGVSLAGRIEKEGALPEAEVIAIAEQILSALAAAHARGIIHRDLKPENIFLVERRGRMVAKLLDFGVSKSLTEHTSTLTMTGAVVGTPFYLSPEQATARRDIDQRADLWAMGVLLYEAVTGVLPFNARNYQDLLRKILGQRPVPPSKFQPRINPAFEALILRALRVDREERPSSANGMLDLLREACEGVGSFDDDDDATEVSESFVSRDLAIAQGRAPDE